VQSLTIRVAVEVILFLLIGIGTYLVVLNTRSFESRQDNGFFCSDTSIRYPKKEESISNMLLLVIWATVAIPIICVVEILFNIINQRKERSQQSIAPIPWLLADLYRIFGCFLLGGLFSQFIVEFTKVEVGELRPHFIAVCQPDLTKDKCYDDEGNPLFIAVENLRCESEHATDPEAEKVLREAKKSFYSGHAQMCFYSATFLIVYLHVRLSPARVGRYTAHPSVCPNIVVRVAFKSLQIVRPFLQVGILYLAIHVSLTRVTDHYHHPHDVLTGALAGTLMAIAMLIFYLQILDRPFVMSDNVGHGHLESGKQTPKTQRLNLRQISTNSTATTEMLM